MSLSMILRAVKFITGSKTARNVVLNVAKNPTTRKIVVSGVKKVIKNKLK